MLLGIEYLVIDVPPSLELVGEFLGFFDTGCTHQDRATDIVEGLDLLENRVVLVRNAQEHAIITVEADHGNVRRNDHDIEVVDLVELGRLGIGRTGHPRKLVIELEEVLDGDRRHRLRFLLDGNAFLGFDRLVQTIGPLPPHHLPAGVLVNDHDRELAFLTGGDDVVTVTLIDGMRSDRLFEKVR